MILIAREESNLIKYINLDKFNEKWIIKEFLNENCEKISNFSRADADISAIVRDFRKLDEAEKALFLLGNKECF